MNDFEHILSKYRPKLVAPVVLFMTALLLTQFYFIFEVTPQPNDECIWEPQMVTKDSVGFFFRDVKLEGVTWDAGIRDGDQLLEINNKPIIILQEASHILNGIAAGDSAIYKVSRDDEIFETKVEVKKLLQFGGFAISLLASIWLIVGFIVIKSKETGVAQITFFRMGLAFVLFSSFNLLISDNIINPLYKNLILLQIVDHLWTFGTVFLPYLILKFFWIFPNTIKFFKRNWIDKLLYLLPTITFVALTIVKYLYVYEGVINLNRFYYGYLARYSFILIFVTAVVGLISLFYNYLKIENKKDRKPIFVILIAYSIGIIAAIYSFILGTAAPAMQYNQPEFFMPIILIALLPVAFGYSIFKYSLLDVSDLVKTTLLYGLGTVGIASTYFLVIYLLGQVLSSVIGGEYQALVAAVIFVGFAIVFQSTKDKFQNLIIRKFYPEQFAYQKVLYKFSNDVVTIVGLDNILKSTTNTFIESLKLAVFGIVIKDNSNGKFTLREGVGLNDSTFVLHANEERLMNFLNNKKEANQALVIEDGDFNSVCPESADILVEQGIYTVIPLIIKNKIIGLLLFGLKYSGSRFAGKDIELLTAAANQTAVSIENARLYESEKEKLILERDLENARKIQNSLLPSVIPRIKGLDISGTMLPAMQVGGDYYDVIKITDSKAFVVVGDVSGKGLAASFYMSKLQTMVKLYCNEKNSPYDVLTKINSRIYKEMEKNWFITCTIALFDSENKSLKICRAGHTPLSVVIDGVIQDFIPDGIGIGLEEGKLFDQNLEELDLQLTDKSLYCLYSDGVNEAMNDKNEMFGTTKFNDILLTQSNSSASEIQKEIIQSLSDHKGDAPQNDDITFVLVKVK